MLAIYYGIKGLYSAVPEDAAPGEAFADSFGPMLAVLGSIMILFAFVICLGLHVALRLVNSRLAIVNTLGTVFFISVGTLICIYLIIINGGSFANQWLSFLAFLILGIGGLLYVLSADKPSSALSIGATVCPLAMFYSITNVLIAKPGTQESADPLMPFLALSGAFGFTLAAMMLPLLTEFDVTLGRTSAANEE